MRSPMSLLNGVPAEVRKVLFGIGLNAFGGGFTLSLFMIYLTSIRGFNAQTVGLLLAWESIVGLAMSGPVGSLIDRIGPAKVMLPGILGAAVAVSLWSEVRTVPQAIALGTLSSVVGSTIWPAQSTLLAQLTSPEERDRTFGLSFMFLNLGFGIGGIGSALVVRDGDASRFELLYRIDGITYLALFVAVWWVRSHAHAVHAAIDRSVEAGGYAEVLRDRRVWFLLIGGIVMFTCGYGAVNTGIPLFATEYADVSVRWLGVIFGFNTFVIVALQPMMIRWVRGRSRALMASLVGITWAISWVVLGASVLFLPIAMLSLGQIIFAIGETIWAPVGPALVNAMAPDQLRGRYNAVMGLQWGISGMAGPALTGAILGRHLGTQWWMLMTVGTLLGAALLLLLRRELDPATDGRVAESSHD